MIPVFYVIKAAQLKVSQNYSPSMIRVLRFPKLTYYIAQFWTSTATGRASLRHGEPILGPTETHYVDITDV